MNSLKKLEQEIKEGKREIVLPKVGKLTLKIPTATELKKAEWRYSRVYNEALMNGIPPAIQLSKKLEQVDAWTTKHSELMQKSSQGLIASRTRLGSEKSTEKRAEMIKQYEIDREEFLEMTTLRSAYFGHSAEIKAEEARMDSIVAQCTYKEDGNKFWESVDKFFEEQDVMLVFQLKSEFLSLLTGVPLDYLATIPEPEDDKKVEEKKEPEGEKKADA